MAVTAARNAWIASGRSAPLSAPAPASLFQDGIASSVDALLRGADFPMRSLTIEVEETALLGAGPDGLAAVERLRARGWGVGLRCAEGCPMPLGRRSRSLFTEILADTPDDLSPALALAEPSARPLTARIRAAHQAGLVTVALNVKSPAQAGLLIALGFDRGAGPGYRV
jgi:EAL domain-containing protein (putative c-di-GMP-specific phosphodiesterase class I)